MRPQKPASPPLYTWRLVFFALVLIQIFVNYDAGAVPGCLDNIRIDGKPLGYNSQGPLQGFVYLGLALGSPLCGVLLHIFPAKKVLVVSLALNAVASLCFGLAYSYWQLMIPRVVVGFTQAAIVVYGPVWVDTFAPEGHTGMWMSGMQISPTLGIVIGYLTSGSLTAAGYHWRWAFIAQAIILFPFVGLLMCLDSRMINADSIWAVRGKAPTGSQRRGSWPEMQVLQRIPSGPSLLGPDTIRSDADPHNAQSHNHAHQKFSAGDVYEILAAIKVLLKTPAFVGCILALSALFFVVTGLQTYSTQYFMEVLGASKQSAVATFSAVSVIGAVTGCVMGGFLVDALGGYEEHRKVAILCLVLNSLAFVVSVPAGFVDTLWECSILFFLMLLFGGATLPAAYGLLVSCVPFEVRSLTSSLSMGVYTVAGYTLAPILIGAVMSATSLQWGFRICLLWGVWGVLAWVLVFVSVTHAPRSRTVSSREVVLGVGGGMGGGMGVVGEGVRTSHEGDSSNNSNRQSLGDAVL